MAVKLAILCAMFSGIACRALRRATFSGVSLRAFARALYSGFARLAAPCAFIRALFSGFDRHATKSQVDRNCRHRAK
jgi:hypothetical protein